MLEVYGPEKTDFLNYIRSIAVAYDGDRWVFDQAGTPFPFEDITRYTSRNIKERFDTELLSHYLEHLGVSAFDESFYLPSPDSTAELVEKHGPTAPGLVESGLAC
jgi:hypothetical protein